MSFTAVRNLALLIMVAIIMAISILSLASTGKIIKSLYRVVSKERPISDKVESIREDFLDASEIFTAFTHGEVQDMTQAVKFTNKAIKESTELKDMVQGKEKEIVADFLTSTKRFKLAIITYADEFKYDPTGSAAISMERVAYAAVEKTTEALYVMNNNIRARLRAADINMFIVARTSQKVILWGIITGIAAGLFAAFFIGRALSKPIRDLAKGIERISKGDLAFRVKAESHDEIGQLTHSFNKMAEDLDHSRRKEKEYAAAVETMAQAERNRANDLDKAYKDLDEFTYVASHDLKEPLRSVDAFSKFIETDYKDKLDDEAKNYLSRIRVNVKRMQKLIEDLLEVSRIDRWKNPFTEVETGNMIDEVKLRLEYAIAEKGAEIVVKGKLPRIFCDRVRIVEVFANFVSNAIKFNDKPHPRIEIGCNQKYHSYEFYVKDNGPGIEEQYFDRIFQIFQRLGKREDHEGTGAGLAIVKKIVQMHKGKVWVESKVGEGVTFYFTIPADKDVILGGKKIGEILVEKGVVGEEDIKEALKEQQKLNKEGELS